MRYKKSVRFEKPKRHAREPRKQSEKGAFPSRTNEKKTFRNFYRNHDISVDFVVAILTDCYNIIPSLRKADLPRDVATLRRRCKSEGIGFITRTLPALFQSVMDRLEQGESSYQSFTLKKYNDGSMGPVFLQRLIEPIHSNFISDADKVKFIDCLYQICVSFKKLKGPYRSTVLRKQLADFVETDISLNYLDWRSVSLKSIRNRARDIISKVIKGLDPDIQEQNFVPRPGPGATNTPTEKHERFRPHVLYRMLNDEFPYEDWFYSHPWDIVDDSKKHPWFLSRADAPTSRFKFVPKTYGKPRGICIEQLEAQYLQQAIKNGLVKRIESHPLTKGRVNFSSQSINRNLALKASLDKVLATLDMSEASDRILRELVEYLFSSNEPLLKKLMALSTRIIELPDEINFITDFPAKKFAPMGSALCFPVMSLVHFSLVQAIVEDSIGRRFENDSPIFVYGDDIVMPSQYTQLVYDILPKFGMKLNVSKSYRNSHFRESCGMHAYHGCEITPVYIKCIPHCDSKEDSILSITSVESQFFKKGFHLTAALFRSELLKVKRLRRFFNLPYVTSSSPAIGWIRETGDCPLMNESKFIKVRWSNDLLCFEVKVDVVVPRSRYAPPIDQNEGYLRWLTTQPVIPLRITEKKLWYDDVAPTASIKITGTTDDLSIKRKWIPESALMSEVLTPSSYE